MKNTIGAFCIVLILISFSTFGQNKIEYFENGKVQTIGQFYDGDFTNIKVGTWQYFNSDGTLNATEQHKVSIEKWGNGKLKIAGGYIYDADKAMWLKTGEWRPYTEDGIPQAVKKFQRGIEVTE